MNVVPRKRATDGSLIVIPAVDHYVLECAVVEPPSSAGRTAYLVLSDEDVTTVLLSLRESAIHARSQSLAEAQPRGGDR